MNSVLSWGENLCFCDFVLNVPPPFAGSLERKSSRDFGSGWPQRAHSSKATPEIVKFLRQMIGGFSILLWIGAAFSWISFGIQLAQGADSAFDNVSR